LILREDEEDKLPELTQLFFSYVFSNSTHIAKLRKEKLRKHIFITQSERKRTSRLA